jgi:hypothetical protein
VVLVMCLPLGGRTHTSAPSFSSLSSLSSLFSLHSSLLQQPATIPRLHLPVKAEHELTRLAAMARGGAPARSPGGAPPLLHARLLAPPLLATAARSDAAEAHGTTRHDAPSSPHHISSLGCDT